MKCILLDKINTNHVKKINNTNSSKITQRKNKITKKALIMNCKQTVDGNKGRKLEKEERVERGKGIGNVDHDLPQL